MVSEDEEDSYSVTLYEDYQKLDLIAIFEVCPLENSTTRHLYHEMRVSQSPWRMNATIFFLVAGLCITSQFLLICNS